MTELGPLTCSRCCQELLATAEGWICPSCHRTWASADGILRSPGYDEDVYWGEVPRGTMQHLLWRARAVGPGAALLDGGSSLLADYVAPYALDWRRALCLEIADVDAEASPVLDYGAGWGTIGLAAAAGPYPHVVLADSSLERLAFSRLLAEARSLSGVTFVAAGDPDSLPFRDESFGIVVLNGVVEWVGIGPPSDALMEQRRVLRSLWRLVRPSGAMYVGMENRFALKYILGYPDDHSELKYTSLMPRKLADAYMRLRRKKSYSTLTWSLPEWRRADDFLAHAEIEVYVLWPDYRFPTAACLAEDRGAVRRLYGGCPSSTARRLIGNALLSTGAMSSLAYSFGVVIRKTATVDKDTAA
jgi:ubiquinone/menaquinone biosynthesis C-methylase UbiE